MKNKKNRLLLNCRISALLVFMILASYNGISQNNNNVPSTRSYIDLPIHIESPLTPIPVKGDDGKWHVAYHLFLTNRGHTSLEINELVVFEENGEKIESYGQNEFKDYYRFRSSLTRDDQHSGSKQLIKKGRTAIVFFWLTFDSKESVPEKLTHQFSFKYSPYFEIWDVPFPKDKSMVIKRYEVLVSTLNPVVIQSPVVGKRWRATLGPAYNTNHQYLVTLNGRTRNPQRFAIDFQKVDSKNIILPTPLPVTLTNDMFYAYGADVYAVADGIVKNVKDGISENTPLASGVELAVTINNETVSGNLITIEIGNNQYAHYAHLQPKSILVKPGDKVVKGQKIALLGSSGNTNGPHLHFHISDGISLNGSEGLPFVIESFYKITDGKIHRMEIPLNGTLMNFSN